MCVDEGDHEKTAFVAPDGLCELKVMPFGPCNTLAGFERDINFLVSGFKWHFC